MLAQQALYPLSHPPSPLKYVLIQVNWGPRWRVLMSFFLSVARATDVLEPWACVTSQLSSYLACTAWTDCSEENWALSTAAVTCSGYIHFSNHRAGSTNIPAAFRRRTLRYLLANSTCFPPPCREMSYSPVAVLRRHS